MNAVQSPLHSAQWVPSHVQITVHTAKDLHLKSKSGHSELYVTLQVDKDQFSTSYLSKQPHPQWNEIFVIPLMSLVTTIHITVRQKGRFGDQYIGYIPINPGNFKISPTQITHWYKLGPKPGKISSKIRGDLKVTFQFLSEWSGKNSKHIVPQLASVQRGSGMLKRTSSDQKIMRESGSAENLIGKSTPPKNKKFASLRRSFRRKKSPILSNCEDDFASFSSHSASPSPQTIRKGCVPDSGSNSLTSTSHYHSDSDTGISMPQSPVPLQIKVTLGAGDSDGEGSAVVADKMTLDLKDKDQEDASNFTVEGKVTPSQFYNFRSKKRPWSMHTLPTTTTTTPSPATTPSSLENPLCQNTAHQPEDEKQDQEDVTLSQPDKTEVSTFKYRPRPSVLSSRSFRGSDHARLSDTNTSPGTRSGGIESEKESGYNSDRVRQSSLSEESSTCNSAEGSKTELNGGGGPAGKAHKRSEVSKVPSTKSHPYSRKIAISPRSASPGQQRVQPRVLAYGKSSQDIQPDKPRSAHLARRSTITSIPSGKRLLPAVPVRRNNMNNTVKGRPVKIPDAHPSENLTVNGGGSAKESDVATFATKLVNSLEDLTAKESRSEVGQSDEIPQTMETNSSSSLPASPSPPLPTSSPNTSESLSSREEQAHNNQKMKHTVQYKTSSPLSNIGFQPASLLPPSLSDYTSYSQTLPTRGKFSKGLSSSMRALGTSGTSNNENSGEGGDEEINSPHNITGKSRTKSDQSPTNTKYVNRETMKIYESKSISPHSSGLAIAEAVASGNETDGQVTKSRPSSNLGSYSQNSTPTPTIASSSSAPATTQRQQIKFGGRKPGEIVTSALRNKRPAGGLKRAITMYQENRKLYGSTRRVDEERCGSCEDSNGGTGGDDSFEAYKGLLLTGEDAPERESFSAGNSPTLRRSKSTRAESIGNLFLSSLRRTRSHLVQHYSTKIRPQSVGDFSGEDATDSIHNIHPSSSSLSELGHEAQKCSAPGLLIQTRELDSTSRCGSEADETSSVSIRVRSPTMTSADTSSICTLTDAGPSVISDQRLSPNPAGAAASSSLLSPPTGGSHVRHTTASSVESEGFYSVSSEDGGLEEGRCQDWTQWSKEALIKELISYQRKLHESETQLKDVKLYMDNILLRIMETDPSILATPS